jgi:AraC-like DNA-binding protein
MRRVGFPILDQPPLAGILTHLSCVDEVVPPPGHFEQTLDLHTIQMTTQGEAVALVNGRAFHHRPGRLFIAGAGAELIEDSQRPWRLRYIMVGGPWCAPLAQLLQTCGGGMMLDRPPRPWTDALTQVVEAGIVGGPGSAWRIASALSTLLGGLTSASPGEGDLLTEIGRLVDAAPERPWAVPALARSLRITPRTLQARFRALTGGGPAAWVLRRRLEHGRLLLQRGIAVHQVADRLGFANQFHFSRVCKRCWGVAPSELQAGS